MGKKIFKLPFHARVQQWCFCQKYICWFDQIHKRLRTWCFGYSAARATLSPKMKQRAPVLKWKSGAAAVSKVFRTTAKIGGFMPTAHDDANHHRLVHSSISSLQYPRQCSANFAPLAPACNVSRLLHHLNPATLSFLAPILSVVSESLPISKHERIFAFTDKKIPFLH